METIVNALLLWIAANSQYNVDEVAMPSIVFVSAEEITTEYYSDDPDQIPQAGIDDRILALYDAETTENGKIFLRVDGLEIDEDARTADALVTPVLVTASLNSRIKSVVQTQPDTVPKQFENDPILMERLLHELVHHVQFQTGANKSFPCPAFGEKDAYQLGKLYFKQRRIEDPLPNRNFWAHIYSRC